jgi:replication factor A1
VIDDSNVEIRLTLWGEKAANNDHPWKSEPIVAFKGVTVGDYGGKSLSALGSTVMTFNPDIPEGHALHAWRSSLGGTLPVAQSLSAGGGMFPWNLLLLLSFTSGL